MVKPLPPCFLLLLYILLLNTIKQFFIFACLLVCFLQLPVGGLLQAVRKRAIITRGMNQINSVIRWPPTAKIPTRGREKEINKRDRGGRRAMPESLWWTVLSPDIGAYSSVTTGRWTQTQSVCPAKILKELNSSSKSSQ